MKKNKRQYVDFLYDLRRGERYGNGTKFISLKDYEPRIVNFLLF